MLHRLSFRMRHWGAALLCLLAVAACSKVPISGRSQLNLVSSDEINSLSAQQYRQFLSENQVVNTGTQAAQVKEVGRRIAAAVEQYMRNNGFADRIAGYNWEFNLVQDPNVNAFCMPGGKVVVFTGLMPVAQTDDGLAVVMGHEIAHAIALHSNERMSQQMVAQVGTGVLSEALANKPQQTQQLLLAAVGLGTQVGILLPFNRQQESEADRLGLIFMTMAGYNPEAAVPFWQRMAAAGGQTPPEFLSTHPSPETRIRDLQKWIPEARRAAGR